MPDAPVKQALETGSRDRQGRITIKRVWVVYSLAEVFTVGEPTLLGFPEDDRDFTERELPGTYQVTITYAGLQNDTPPEKDSWNGDISLREEPIETMPGLAALAKKYGGSAGADGKVTWPQYITSGSGTSQERQVTNPMFGATTYPEIQGEVTREYARKTIPADLLSRIGAVLKTLPGSSGIKTPKGFVWITQTPSFATHGDAWSIRERYRLTRAESYQSIIQSLLKI